jgi:hypothetical protein
VVQSLGARALEIGPEIALGVPALRVAGRPLVMALKSGNFGQEDFFARAARILAVCGSGRIRHREFAMAAGEMSQQEFTAFLGTAFGHLAGRSADGAIHFVCMDWRHMAEILAAGQAHYTELKNLMVWDNGGPRGRP